MLKTNVVSFKIPDPDISDDAVSIRQVAGYCRSRAAGTEAAMAWLSIGQQLLGLRGQLKKKTPHGDNLHIGWVKAFEQLQPNGKREFPFTRRMADRYINVHEFLDGTMVPSNLHRYLPASFRALETMVKHKMTRQQIESGIEDGSINPLADARQIAALMNSIRLVSKRKSKVKRLSNRITAQSPKRERISSVVEMLKSTMTKLDISFEDVAKEFGK